MPAGRVADAPGDPSQGGVIQPGDQGDELPYFSGPAGLQLNDPVTYDLSTLASGREFAEHVSKAGGPATRGLGMTRGGLSPAIQPTPPVEALSGGTASTHAGSSRKKAAKKATKRSPTPKKVAAAARAAKLAPKKKAVKKAVPKKVAKKTATKKVAAKKAVKKTANKKATPKKKKR